VPEITAEQAVRFGIFCGKAVYQEQAWTAWADGWLSGADRSESAAWSAASAAAWAAWAARSAASLDLAALAHEACALPATER
jgi:hypothetical protein